jgi:hypothetical protein
LRLPEAQLLRPERHVLPDRRTEELVVRVLEQQADAAPYLGQVGLDERQAIHGDRGHRRRTVRQQAVQVQQQGRLARAIGADQRHAFARPQRERQPAQRLVAVRVAVGELVDGEQAHAFQPRAHIAR